MSRTKQKCLSPTLDDIPWFYEFLEEEITVSPAEEEEIQVE